MKPLDKDQQLNAIESMFYAPNSRYPRAMLTIKAKALQVTKQKTINIRH